MDCILLDYQKVFGTVHQGRLMKLNVQAGARGYQLKGTENTCQWRLLQLGESDNWGPSGFSAGTITISDLRKIFICQLKQIYTCICLLIMQIL